MNSKTALVLFSGGQDSTTCLAWALGRFKHVETVGFDYGQRHVVELAARPVILDALNSLSDGNTRLGIDHVLPINTLKAIGGSALTSAVKIAMGSDGLPTTFVPARNLMFLVAAGALGYRRGISELVGGMCETDYSGYPDCRHETIEATARALSLGLARETTIHTPLMHLNKAATWRLAEELGGSALVELIIRETVTCYAGDPEPHDWGKGCGRCPACDLRARGYASYRGTHDL
jgi:7-cyano-7-deazaguanine synthase